ncbi:MAG: hypothetical protein NVS9B14_09120 [Candidatus Acidiferrum sp.]
MDRKTVRIWGGRLLVAAVASLVLVLLGTSSAVAQFDTGAVLGTVTDSSGAAINGATVTLTNEGTTAAVTFTTGADGAYKFTPVRVGSYKVTVTAQGFQTAVHNGVLVDVGKSAVVDVSLKPGAVSETVEVTASVPVLQSQDASVGQIVDQRNVNNLPLNGRNFTFLAQIVAGVNSPQEDGRGNEANGAFSANGLRSAQNNYLLDGLDNNSNTVDFLNGTNFVILPPIDAIEEFKVQTSGFSAEFGRSGAAILNATIKSGTNQIHGAAWEFLRNDKFDAADFFENANGIKKGEFRYNEFGVSAGGPVVIPKLFDGRNKVFFFADYQGTRRRQGAIQTGTVPTAFEASSGYLNFSDLITDPTQSALAPRKDTLGRSIGVGTFLDPATTRQTTAGVADPVTGIVAAQTGWVRDPLSATFGTVGCPVTTTSFGASNVTACGLNQLNLLAAGRIDSNVINLLKLYPAPTTGAISNNFSSNRPEALNRNAFDARLDFNLNQANQVFGRFSLVDAPDTIPGLFSGIADGGSFSQGNQTAISEQSVLGFTHTFNPTLINVVHAGLTYLHTTRVSPEALNYTGTGGQGVPLDYGIKGIPQNSENGGLPAFNIGNLAQLGGNAFLPSDEVSSTFQMTDDLTKIYGKHSFKMGFEWQHVKFSTLQPPWSHGQFGFGGNYTDVPNVGGGNTGIAQALLVPKASTVAGPDFLGGPGSVFVSNISLTDNGKNYYGTYFQDDWKVTNKLTLNLGLRWDYFQPVYEHHGAQGNFVPSGPPTGQPLYLLPNASTSSDLSASFLNLLQADGIGLSAGRYGKSLGVAQKNNFAPRVGMAYQMTKKFVIRSGFGLFYDGFENRGFSPNLGENYPFQFNFSFFNPNDFAPITAFAGCPDATPVGSPTFETGFACTPLSPLQVNASGLGLRGIQYDYKTPYSMGGNLTVQYQLSPTMSIQAGYVGTFARHLEVFPNSNHVDQILPVGTDIHAANGCPTENFPNHACLPFPDFGEGGSYATTNGNSYYHSLQTKFEKQFGNGLSFLATYTWSKVMTDALDLLNGGHVGGYRAPSIQGFGIHGDYGLGNADIRNVFHFSGQYELPIGKGKKFLTSAHGITNQVFGGWATVWLVTLQGGQPITVGCPQGAAADVGCNAIKVANPNVGLHNIPGVGLSWIGNTQSFTQPCPIGAGGNPVQQDIGGIPCVALSGLGALGGSFTQLTGPGLHRADLSLFKNFSITERIRMEFRSEFFNLTNHPNFSAPSDLNYADGARFGLITSTRQTATNPRQIQFALKLYY